MSLSLLKFFTFVRPVQFDNVGDGCDGGRFGQTGDRGGENKGLNG